MSSGTRGLLTIQSDLLEKLRVVLPVQLIEWATEDPATQGGWRVRYSLACYYAATDSTDGGRQQALRQLRIAIATSHVAALSRVDPSLEPLRSDWRPFDEALSGVGTPRLTDLGPLRPIGVKLKDAGIFTPFQLIARARTPQDRTEVERTSKIPAAVLEAAARYADLGSPCRGIPKRFGWLWTRTSATHAISPTRTSSISLAGSRLINSSGSGRFEICCDITRRSPSDADRPLSLFARRARVPARHPRSATAARPTLPWPRGLTSLSHKRG